jgi:hypothetical protein
MFSITRFGVAIRSLRPSDCMCMWFKGERYSHVLNFDKSGIPYGGKLHAVASIISIEIERYCKQTIHSSFSDDRKHAQA